MTGDLGEHLDVIPLTDFSYVDAILQQHTRPTVSEPTLFRSEVAVRDFPKTVQSALRRRKERRRRGRKRRVRTREGESGFNADNLLGCWPRNWCLAGTKSETLLALAGGFVPRRLLAGRYVTDFPELAQPLRSHRRNFRPPSYSPKMSQPSR